MQELLQVLDHHSVGKKRNTKQEQSHSTISLQWHEELIAKWAGQKIEGHVYCHWKVHEFTFHSKFGQKSARFDIR